MAMAGRRGGCLERIAVILRRGVVVTVMAHMQMRSDFAARHMVRCIAYVRNAGERGIAGKDQRQEEGETQSHCRRF